MDALKHTQEQIERLASQKEALRAELQHMTDLFEVAVQVAESRNGQESTLDRRDVARARATLARVS